MSYLICPHCGDPIQVFHRGEVPRTISSGDVPLLAKIPLDPVVSEAGDTGRPILVTMPDSAQAAAFYSLVDAVTERLKL
jgi:ATP-binding protein involved in chromosome partitioning